MKNQYYVYIMANLARTLYIGVTNDLERRVYEHKNGLVPGFTSRYHLIKLVYFECGEDVTSAIEREKQIKGWLRSKKISLIESINPDWEDLSKDWFNSYSEESNSSMPVQKETDSSVAALPQNDNVKRI